MSGYIVTDGDRKNREYGTGLKERDYNSHPVGYCSQPFRLPLIPRNEWEDRWQAMKRSKAQTSDLVKRRKVASLNQTQSSYCWAYSSTMATMLTYMRAVQHYVPLSGTSIACKIKGFRNQGGWCTQSLEYITEHGVCRIDDWPQGKEGIRKDYDSPTAWKAAAKYRVTEWMDLEPGNRDQLITCLLSGLPVATDFNWWGHSVCTIDIADIQVRQGKIKVFDSLIKNSWGDRWGDKGHGVLQGSKAIPNGAIAPLVTVGG